MRYFISFAFNMQPPQWMISLYCVRSSGNSVPEVKVNSGSAFVNWRIQFGSFTVPISPHCLWWVQPSQIRILSPVRILFKAATPAIMVSSSPLYLAKRMEKEVSRMSSGCIFWNFSKCLAVCDHQLWLFSNIFQCVFQFIIFYYNRNSACSKISRMVCCCGRIRRPLGAALSIGTTKITKSEGSNRSDTSGFETVDTIHRLKNKIQIWLPDLKYSDDLAAIKYSNAPNYFNTATTAIKTMYKTSRTLPNRWKWFIKKWCIIRHLLLPNMLENTLRVIDWIADNFEPGQVLFSLMHQYIPCGRAAEYPEINRVVTAEEYQKVEQLPFQFRYWRRLCSGRYRCQRWFLFPSLIGTGV